MSSGPAFAPTAGQRPGAAVHLGATGRVVQTGHGSFIVTPNITDRLAELAFDYTDHDAAKWMEIQVPFWLFVVPACEPSR
ncbi:hypothetical protein AU467_30050 [Mesorhizobium loti]|uniref:Uncharacterized protein n=1 Tax=Rhizobium loti TaxID=381 RepID=A0A124GFR2_RHILI|nr:hypothetical protein AU467_30050 [Mesorhizobium loti]